MYGPGTPTFYRDGRGHTIMAVNTWKYSGGQDNPKNHGQIMHKFEVHIARERQAGRDVPAHGRVIR